MDKKHIVLHHSLTDRDTTRASSINRYHAQTLGWGRIGYHFVIEGDGKLVDCAQYGTTRDKVGYHCKQNNMNYISFGICLTGNFDVEDPSTKQLETLKSVVLSLAGKYDIPEHNFHFHREFATYKSCPGNRLDKETIKKFIFEKGKNAKVGTKKPAQKDEEEPEIIKWAKKEGIASKWDKPYDPDKLTMAYMLRNHIEKHHKK